MTQPPAEKHHSSQAGRNPAAEEDFPAGSLLRKVVIYGKKLAIEEDYIALIRQVSPKKKKSYHRNSHVPIKDFGSFLKSLSGQFKGNLSTIKDSKLKKLTLPVMTPTGIGLPDIPEESATQLVVVYSGQWNGALFCSEVDERPVALRQFRKEKNGDILGVASVENGEELFLLNLDGLLKREGFLSMVY